MANYNVNEKDPEIARHLENASTPSPPHSTDEKGMHTDLMTLDKPGVNPDSLIIELSEKDQKRILRKVDWRLIPLLTFLYLVAFIDRSNSEFENPMAIERLDAKAS
jgi:hypothetical protein